jgi:hypothetical protein
MKARNIKPGFFENEDLHEVSLASRLIFIGMWCMADREGRLEDRPKKIKLKLIPYDDVDIFQCLDELTTHGFLIRYEAENQRFIQIVNFAKHQSPHPKEKPSSIPSPDVVKIDIAQALLDERITEDEAGMSINEAQQILTETEKTRDTNSEPFHEKEEPFHEKEEPFHEKEEPFREKEEPLHESPGNSRLDSLIHRFSDSLIQKTKTPSSSTTQSEPETQPAFSSPAVMGGRLRKPAKGKQASTGEWVNALGNGLKDWFEDEWWPAQLRMVGKKDCAIAIYNLNPDKLLRDRIMAAYLEQRENDFSKRDPPKVPHPTTWITGCRWEDKTQHSDPYGIEE